MDTNPWLFFSWLVSMVAYGPRFHAASALGDVASHSNVTFLINGLRKGKKRTQAHAVEGLARLCEQISGERVLRKFQDAVREEGGIEPLGKLFSRDDDADDTNFGIIFEYLAFNNSQNQDAIREECMKPLLQALSEPNPKAQLQTARRATRLADLLEENSDNQPVINQYLQALAPFIQTLIAHISGSDEKKQLEALQSLVFLSMSKMAQRLIREEKGIDSLIPFLKKKGLREGKQEMEVQMHAIAALCNLAWESQNQVAIREAGGIPPLIQTVVEETKKNSAAAAVVLGILQENPENEDMIRKFRLDSTPPSYFWREATLRDSKRGEKHTEIQPEIIHHVLRVLRGEVLQNFAEDDAYRAFSILSKNNLNYESLRSKGAVELLTKLQGADVPPAHAFELQAVLKNLKGIQEPALAGEAVAQVSPDIVCMYAVAFIGLFIGSGVTFASVRLRQRASPAGQEPLLLP